MSNLKVGLTGVNNSDPITSSNPLPVTQSAYSGNTGGNVTSVNGSVPNTSTGITFTAPSSNFVINIGGTTPAITYLSFVSPASNANFAINQTSASPGSYSYTGPPVSEIWIIGASAAGTYSLIAF